MDKLPTIREKVERMAPEDAVNYLLWTVEDLFPAVVGVEHAVDKWEMRMNPCERLVLCALVDAFPRWMSYHQLSSIIAHRGDPDNMPGADIVKVHVCRIRQKLSLQNGIIETLWGRGYRFIPSGQEVVLP